MAKRKFRVGDKVLWQGEMATVVSIDKSRAKIKTDSAEKLGYNHITSVNTNELKLVNVDIVADE